MVERLGVDIGKVVIAEGNELFSEDFLRARRVEGAFEALTELNRNRFEGQIYLVSKCFPKMQTKTREWLEDQGFYEQTGITRDHLKFCLRRSDKAKICTEFAITHFIDDKLEVLSHMSQVPNLYLFRPNPQEVDQYMDFLYQIMEFNPRTQDIHQVMNWQEVLKQLNG